MTETVPAADLRPDDHIRTTLGWRRVVSVEHTGDMVLIATAPPTGAEPMMMTAVHQVTRRVQPEPAR